MFRSQPIPMITEGKQLSVVKLAACYKYKCTPISEGVPHLGVHSYLVYGGGGGMDLLSQPKRALCIKLYGINHSGVDVLIAKCYLNTITGYVIGQYAASIITGIPVKEFPAIYYTYDLNESQQVVTDFERLIDMAMFIDVRIIPDVLETTNYTQSGA